MILHEKLDDVPNLLFEPIFIFDGKVVVGPLVLSSNFLIDHDTIDDVVELLVVCLFRIQLLHQDFATR